MKLCLYFLTVLQLVLTGSLWGQQDGRIEGGAAGLIGPSDTVSVKVFREPDLDAAGRLGRDGSLTMPLIGSVKLAGLTTAAAEKMIEAKLFDGYLVNPQVTVLITARPVETVTVSGQVKSPGVYVIQYGQRLTLLEAIAQAGGVTEIAKSTAVTVVSGRDGVSRTYNLKAIMKGQHKDVALAKGDSINVPESFF